MIKKILVVIVALVAGLAVYIQMQPAEFHVERATLVSAPPSGVFPHVNNLRHWQAWSPWAKLDPNAQETFEGPEEGEGAVMRWSGNQNVGKGSMTITESRPNELIRFRLDFVKPFKATSTAEFTFQPQGDQTVVTWKMDGKNNFIGKAIGLFMDCDKMIGEQFDKGLAQLKTVA